MKRVPFMEFKKKAKLETILKQVEGTWLSEFDLFWSFHVVAEYFIVNSFDLMVGFWNSILVSFYGRRIYEFWWISVHFWSIFLNLKSFNGTQHLFTSFPRKQTLQNQIIFSNLSYNYHLKSHSRSHINRKKPFESKKPELLQMIFLIKFYQTSLSIKNTK